MPSSGGVVGRADLGLRGHGSWPRNDKKAWVVLGLTHQRITTGKAERLIAATQRSGLLTRVRWRMRPIGQLSTVWRWVCAMEKTGRRCWLGGQVGSKQMAREGESKLEGLRRARRKGLKSEPEAGLLSVEAFDERGRICVPGRNETKPQKQDTLPHLPLEETGIHSLQTRIGPHRPEACRGSNASPRHGQDEQWPSGGSPPRSPGGLGRHSVWDPGQLRPCAPHQGGEVVAAAGDFPKPPCPPKPAYLCQLPACTCEAPNNKN